MILLPFFPTYVHKSLKATEGVNEEFSFYPQIQVHFGSKTFGAGSSQK